MKSASSIALVRAAAVAWIAAFLLPGLAAASAPSGTEKPLAPFRSIEWPAGTSLVPFENLEGLILFEASLHAGARQDTSGLFVLDSGAGYLALDHELAWTYGLAGSERVDGVSVTRRPLRRFTVGDLQIDQLSPILTFEATIVRRITDRQVLGLFGQSPLVGRAVWIDYRDALLAIVPMPQEPGARARSPEQAVPAAQAAAERFVSARALAIPFRLEGDGKILVSARVADPRPPRYSPDLTLIIDTGATWCVFFEDEIDDVLEQHRKWPSVSGISAPTLFGDPGATVARVPTLEIRSNGVDALRRDVDVALITSELSGMLTRAVQEDVHGLVGYSYLRNYRVGIDYVNRVLWLDPMPDGWEGRPYRDSHVGIQIERREGVLRVAGVIPGSPAASAGIEVGDDIVGLQGKPATEFDVPVMLRAFEGPPGSHLEITTKRGDREKSYRLVRRKLL
jgi:hypothetical protein